MPKRNAKAVWKGNLRDGNGTMKIGNRAQEEPFTFKSRFEEGAGTNPEELLGAAYAGCFSMALAHSLAEAGHNPRSIQTSAEVNLEKGKDGFGVESILLRTEGDVPGLDGKAFSEFAEKASQTCPVSKALGGVKKTVEAKLTS